MGNLPIHDWQFWAATMLAVAALTLLVKPLFPRKKSTKSSCPGCPTGEAAAKNARPKHVDLTIEGKRLRK
jgi:hypothetical protein